jgi:hypothetical protein
MAVLYDLRMAIEKKIEADHLDATHVRGQIGLKAGKLISLISPNTPDDPVVIGKLRSAAREVLGLNI